MKVSQEPLKITDILKDKTFTVPLYQREYSWNLEQVADLFYDISDSDDDGHFLGSLLLYQSDNSKKMEIVDGQQRMTTLFLLLYSILKALNGSDKNKAIERINSLLFVIDPNDLSNDISSSEPRLETGKRDKYLFKAIIRNDDFSAHKDGRRRSHKNLTNSLEFFDQRIVEIIKDQGLNGLTKFTEKVIKSEFIVMTAEKQSDKLLLFKTINARGLELTQGDLIKNELCHNIEPFELDEAIDNWDEIRSRIEKNNGNLDVFLFHYLNSIDECQNLRQQLDKKRGLEKWEKKNYPPAPEKYVFELYGALISKVGPSKFIEDLLLASNYYTAFINPSNDKVYLNSLKAMGVNKCFPLLLASVRKLNNENFDKVCKAIDSLTFRHSILRKDPKELERFYYQVSESLVDDLDVENAINTIKEHLNFKEEEKFKSEFVLSSMKGSVSKMVLDRITRKHSESVDWTNKDVHIEHIMPQKPAGEWKILFDSDEFEYKDYLNRLGNLTILQDKKNIKARNKDFNNKKEYYKESRLTITKTLIDYEKWGYSEILERQEYLYEESKDLWN
ncbi:DUF262 domain-containing protein [Kaistella carnis]|uniref:DUF262 domain-containing protein n=1 Tax=Kaistella carnis TaxID=1241979 RepID=A0A3G8XHR8_9FLAO|nr:DUF262 domain-containing protein [Kaistella carnis]AZI32278.1 DUF262 domain-containing protein [Kaistella carnis]